MNTTSDKPKAMARRLRAQVQQLVNNHLLTENQPFPSLDQLNRLGDAIFRLAKAAGIKLYEPPYVWKLVERLDKRFSALHLGVAIGRLADKASSVPSGPLTTLQKAAQNRPADEQLLIRIGKYVVGTNDADLPQLTWEEYQQVLPYTSKTFRTLWRRPRGMSEVEHLEHLKSLMPVLGHAALLDLQRQYLCWQKAYGNAVIPSASWIYIFLNKTWDEKLRVALHGDAASPDEVLKQHERVLARKRQQKRRKK